MYVSGIDDFFKSIGSGLTSAAKNFTQSGQAIIQAKQAYDVLKSEWKGTPYALPQSAATNIQPYSVGATDERFIPGTYQLTSIKTDRALNNGDEMRAFQNALVALGFLPGAVDGILGPNTRGAMQTWQRSYNLPVTTSPMLTHLETARAQIDQRRASQAPSQQTTTPAQSIATGGQPSIFYPQQSAQSGGMPSWMLPAAIGGVGLLMFVAMQGKRR